MNIVSLFEENDLILNANNIFPLREDSVKRGYLENFDSIKVDLPSENWQIKDIELNFTNIDFGTEIKVIENNTSHNTYKRVFNKNPGQNLFGMAVQLEIRDTSLIYGVYIYGYHYLSHPGTPEIQIRGFNSENNHPNSSIIKAVDLNLSSTPNWYLQKFNTPVLLKPGNYSLVLDGLSIPVYTINDAGFYWSYNSVDPTYPNLYVSEYTDNWSNGIRGEPFLYKVIQKLNSTIYPEEINMTAQLDGNSYTVMNGHEHGRGYLKKNQINYHVKNKEVNIKVKNNKTKFLRFNIDYNFNIYNFFNSSGTAIIKYNESTKWYVYPEISRHSKNDTIKFIYPNSWENIHVKKNSIDISSDVIVNTIDNTIIIPNNTIQNNAEWEISSLSPNIAFKLNIQRHEFKTGQTLSFTLGSNPLYGIYVLKLFDPSGLLTFQTQKEIPSENNIFSFPIPSNAIEGKYTAFIFWNNGTDAGVQSAIFTIIYAGLGPQNFDFSPIITIGAIIVGSGAAISTGYFTTKKVKSNKRERLKLVLERCKDILNLKYVIVLDPKTGIDLFSQSFEKKELDPTLIAGFLQAIHNFGDEVLEGVKESKIIKVEYKDSIIVMTDFINVRLIIILKSNPSKNFIYSIESLAYHVYKYYGKLIESFKGNLKPFQSINKLVESDLNVSLRYPMTIKIQKKIKLTQNEKEIIKRALDIMKENRISHFYAIYLLPENNSNPKDYETILQLIKKGIFQPINKTIE